MDVLVVVVVVVDAAAIDLGTALFAFAPNDAEVLKSARPLRFHVAFVGCLYTLNPNRTCANPMGSSLN